MRAAPVLDARPPSALVRIMNPILRMVLRTPFGRLVRPFALLEFDGRRSGHRYRVPVGWHTVGRRPVVFTPAPWRANFLGDTPVTVHFRGRSEAMTGRLEATPDAVAELLQSLFAEGTSPMKVGLRVQPGHQIDATDVTSVDRAALTFHSLASTPARLSVAESCSSPGPRPQQGRMGGLTDENRPQRL